MCQWVNHHSDNPPYDLCRWINHHSDSTTFLGSRDFQKCPKDGVGDFPCSGTLQRKVGSAFMNCFPISFPKIMFQVCIYSTTICHIFPVLPVVQFFFRFFLIMFDNLILKLLFAILMQRNSKTKGSKRCDANKLQHLRVRVDPTLNISGIAGSMTIQILPGSNLNQEAPADAITVNKLP